MTKENGEDSISKVKYWKVLNENRMPCHGGSGQWPPPGEWREQPGDLIPCENGLHVCRKQDLMSWLGPEIWEVEVEGETVEAEDKVVCRKVRLVRKLDTWNDRAAILFAADCGERVLPIYEKAYPKDDRPKKAIKAARDYVNGKITQKELDAARDAAGDAAWDAAGDAPRAAAWDAAGAAVWSAARAAAWAAARDAAGSAARAAAWAAARDAAGDAAWDAAWDAAGEWQTSRLMSYIYPKSRKV